jgi:hypothetical protein
MEHADKRPSLAHHPRPEAERAAAYEAGAAWGMAPPLAAAGLGLFQHSPQLLNQRAWAETVHGSPRAVAQRSRIDELFRAPEPQVVQARGLAGPGRPAGSGVVQAKVKLSTVGRVGLGILKGLLNAVAPFFAGYDYAANLHSIHKDRTGEGVLYGKGMGLAVLAGAKETAQLVATLATAAGILFGIISAFMPPVAAAATIAGVVATVAHAVTLVLRAVSTGALYARLRSARSNEYRKRGALKAQIYNEIGGMVGNALGVLFGGLGGGFTPTAAANPLSTMATNATASSGGQAAAYLGVGQVGNSLADAAGGIGGAKARGAEHRAERRALDPGVELPQVDHMPEEDEEVDEQPLRNVLLVLPQLQQEASQDQQESAESRSELQDQVGALGEGTGELQLVVQQMAPVEGVTATLQGIETGELQDAGEEQVATLESAVSQVQQVMPEAAEPVEEVPEEQEEVDEEGYLADDESKDDSAQRQPRQPFRAKLQARQAAAVAQADGTKKPGIVRRVVNKIKGKGKALLARALGLGRQLRKAFAKLRAKFMAKVLEMLGLKEPALQAQVEVADEKTRVPAAIESQQRLEVASTDVAAKTPEAAAGIGNALSSLPSP